MHDQTWYSGKESYKYVDKLLYNNERSLRIVSPFISKYYAKRINQIAKRKSIYIITSKATARDEKELKSLFSRPSWGVSTLLYLTVLSVIIAALGLYFFSLITISLLGIMFWRYIKGINTKLHLKVVSSDFIHEKLYISDTIAITGSANLTYSGMHRNVESISITNNLDDIERLKRHFDKLWHTYREQQFF